jgi:magnesium transporter
MVKIFKTFGGYIEIPEVAQGCWINVINPTPEEIERVSSEFDVPNELVNDILDVDERPRLEIEDDFTLVILRIPIEVSNNGVPYYTIPLGIIIKEKYTVTICTQENEILPIGQPSQLREQYRQISDTINFILRLFLRSSNVYLKYLKQINQITNSIEHDLEKSIKNSELNKLLKMEKCLVYFITSLKSNEIVLAKLRNSRKITSEINEDMLEDAIIENKQALEMAQIYSDIQSGMMDAFASIISNNLNGVMKQLTIISIVLMIPTLIASLFGMNVPNLLEDTKWAMLIIILGSIGIAYVSVVTFRKRKWF